MKRLFFIFGGLMLLALTACVNEKISIDDQFAGEKITVKAYMPEGNTPSTRVSLDGNPTTTGAFELSWSQDDKFSVFSKNLSEDVVVGPVNFKKTDKPNEFEIEEGYELATADKYYAVYPVTTSTDPEEVPFNISIQNKLPFLMYASSEDGKSFKFNHALAYLKLKITLPVAYKDYNSSSRALVVQLPGSWAAVYPKGDLFIDTYSDNAFLEFDSDADPYIVKEVTIECNDGENGNTVKKDGVTVGYILEVMFAIPPMSQYSAELKIFDESPINSKMYGATLEKGYGYKIEAGKYYTAEITLEEQVDDDEELS